MLFSRTSMLVLPLIALTACSSGHSEKGKLANAQYWQRANATSALYMRGEKAQQMLHRDIAGCTRELNELTHLRKIRESIPAETENSVVPDPETPRGHLAQWDTPERDGALYSEHGDYHDFETCMTSKGWERMEYLPYAQADRARSDYAKGSRHRGKKQPERENVTSVFVRAQPNGPGSYPNVNN